jgi:aerobic carbon-monoxide dehydrogenase medium subunit
VAHHKMSFRERPAITVAANLTVRDGAVANAKLAVGSVGVAVQRLPSAEQALLGTEAEAPSEDQLGTATEAAARQADPVPDANGSVEYKRQLVRVLVGRCVREALAQAHARPA